MKQISHLRKNKAAFESALERAAAKLGETRIANSEFESAGPSINIVESEAFEAVRNDTLEALPNDESLVIGGELEAIVLADLRPPFFITDNKIVVAGNYDEVELLNQHVENLEIECLKVGRVDLVNHRMPYAGTGWLIDDNIVVTNRHVAEVFGSTMAGGFCDFKLDRFGERLSVSTNAYRQNQTPQPADYVPMLVTKILYMARPGEPDFAFLQVNNINGVEPIQPFSRRAEAEQPIAAVGYPAEDANRNDRDLMNNLFDCIYRVKRFSPGQCTGYDKAGLRLLADYTTLGGNSGSAVLDIASGKAVALHFAGIFEEVNLAVPADIVWAALRKVHTLVPVTGAMSIVTKSTSVENLSGRFGYDPEFLGSGALSVNLPALGNWAADVAPVEDDEDGVLKYTHFSSIQSKSRRLPLLTAVNIDGDMAFKLKRKGSWRLDGRLERKHQLGNELYKHNPLDRGHMVRRMDPGWGVSKSEAQQGEIDTFHYTNCAPQHKDLNQKDWVGLEDHILESAITRGFKLSVLTGPVFKDSDKLLRDQPGAEDVKIPEHFWKIVVMINDATGELSATGYLLTHGELIRDITEAAFVLGEYKTYQVKISKIQNITGLGFSDILENDPLHSRNESVFGEGVIELDGYEGLVL